MKNIIVELKILVSVGKVKKNKSHSVHSVYQAHLLNNPMKDMSQVTFEEVEFKPIIIFKDEKLTKDMSNDELRHISDLVINESLNHIKQNNVLPKLSPSILN